MVEIGFNKSEVGISLHECLDPLLGFVEGVLIGRVHVAVGDFPRSGVDVYLQRRFSIERGFEQFIYLFHYFESDYVLNIILLNVLVYPIAYSLDLLKGI